VAGSNPSRLTCQRSYTAGNRTHKADYVYDALDRTVTETETHTTAGRNRTTLPTAFTYQRPDHAGHPGSTDRRHQPEDQDLRLRRLRPPLSMTDQITGTPSDDAVPFSYGHGVHGSVSQLLTDAGTVKASYGYDAYGRPDPPATDPQSLTHRRPRQPNLVQPLPATI
jgi:hypothetical protein